MHTIHSVATTVKTNLQQLSENLQRGIGQLGQRAGEAVQQMQQQLAQHLLDNHAGPTPLLASVSTRLASAASRVSQSRAQPLFDLAFNPEELKFRLSAVPVYTVVDADNNIVLVSGDDTGKQLGLFFFKESDAQAMIDTVRSKNPKLGKKARVLRTSVDQAYEMAVSPKEALGLEGDVLFRFIPDGNQVERAVQLFRQAGVSQQDFVGVPLFQAEGLTVKSDDRRYTPLFFSKDDLDNALQNASLFKDNEQQAETRKKAEQAQADLRAAEAEVAAAASEKERKAAQRKVETSASRLERYEQRLQQLGKEKRQPRVDVGSLEEVIHKMEQDEKGEWGDVMFIPPGMLSEKGGGEQEQQAQKATAAVGRAGKAKK
ncbi:hypothetical protein N2152v2_002194 [Parachlorella kessleri]